MMRTPGTEPRGRWCAIVLLLMVVLGWPIARSVAQIYEWVDRQGDRHYDTSLDAVPEAERSQARLVVSEGRAGTPEAPAPPTPAAAPADAREGKDPYDAGWDTGFSAGWQAGYQAAMAEAPICPREPQVVMLQSQPPVVNVPLYDPSGAYYRSPYGGMLTVPFDDGASRGLTAREQMQQQRALERGW